MYPRWNLYVVKQGNFALHFFFKLYCLVLLFSGFPAYTSCTGTELCGSLNKVLREIKPQMY